MSATSQAKAKRRQMSNGYAHLGGAMKRPTVSGFKGRTVKEAMAAAAHTAARMAKAKG